MATRNKPVQADEEKMKGAAVQPMIKPFRFGFLVHDVSRTRRMLFDTAMLMSGLTHAQWSVLAALSRLECEDGVMQVDLARMMNLGKATVGRMIDRLETVGILERRLDFRDRRARHIFITGKGFEVIAEMQEAGTKLNKSILAGLTSEELRITEKTLARAKANIRQMLADD